MNLSSFALSDVGRVRRENQDAFAGVPELGLWVLCDGMGGHLAGGEAARRAVAAVVEKVEAGESLEAAVAAAHAAVAALGDELVPEGGRGRPGATVVALKADAENYEIVWVGDSRAWLWDGKELACLTRDHSFVQELVDWGELTPAEARAHPRRHQLTQALGVAGGAGSGGVRPGRVCGKWHAARQLLLLTSDGVFCHDDPEGAVKLLAGIRDSETAARRLLAESLRRGGGDNITVVAVGGRAAGDAASGDGGAETEKRGETEKEKDGGQGGKLMGRGGLRRVLRRLLPGGGFLPFMLLFLALFAGGGAWVPGARAAVPPAAELEVVCRESAERLAAGVENRHLKRVAVYFFCPRGRRLEELDDKARGEGREIALALQDALTAQGCFTVLNRDNEAWARVLHEEAERGTINGNDILKVGRGLGARWIVTGEYWSGPDGLFHLRTRLFNGETGEMAAAGFVDSSFVSSHRHSLRPLIWTLLAGLVLVLGLVTFFNLSRKRRRLQEQRRAEEERLGSREAFAAAVYRREPEVLARIDSGDCGDLPSELRSLAEALSYRAPAFAFRLARGRRLIWAQASEAGLGRGDKWFFSCSDPRVSRAPQAFLRLDGGRAFLVHNRKASGFTRVNGEEAPARPLQVGDEIALSSATCFKVVALPVGGVVLEEVAGPESGRLLVLSGGGIGFKNILPEADPTYRELGLETRRSRCLLVCGPGPAAGLELVNSAFVGRLGLEAGGKAVLAPGDRLLAPDGRELFAFTPLAATAREEQ